MPKIPVIKAKAFRGHLIDYGCVEVSVRSSHHKIRNPQNGKVTVLTIHTGKDIDKGAFSSLGLYLNPVLLTPLLNGSVLPRLNIWFNPKSNHHVTVDTKIKSRHMANGILKECNIDYHF